MADDLKVEARGVESGARSYDDVGNAAALVFSQLELIERAVRQARGEALEQLHTARSGGKISRHIDLLFVAPRAIFSWARIHKRVTVIDCGQARHAPKELAWRSLGEEVGCKIDECCVDIVFRDRRGNSVNIGGRHFCPFMAIGLSLCAFSKKPFCDVSRKCNYLDAESSRRKRNARGSGKKSQISANLRITALSLTKRVDCVHGDKRSQESLECLSGCCPAHRLPAREYTFLVQPRTTTRVL